MFLGDGEMNIKTVVSVLLLILGFSVVSDADAGILGGIKGNISKLKNKKGKTTTQKKETVSKAETQTDSQEQETDVADTSNDVSEEETQETEKSTKKSSLLGKLASSVRKNVGGTITNIKQDSTNELIEGINSEVGKIGLSIDFENKNKTERQKAIDEIIRTKTSEQDTQATNQNIYNFAGRELTDEDMPYLRQQISSKNLQKIHLNLSNNQITAEGVKQLFTAEGEDQQKFPPQALEAIDLSNNPIGKDGVVNLASQLESMPLLKYIYLPQIELDGNGALVLISIISKLINSGKISNIEIIDISNNKIDGSYVDAIISAMESIKTRAPNLLLMIHNNPIANVEIYTWPKNIIAKVN